MRNRIPTYPGRVRLIPVTGMENVYTMTRADDPTDEGTPLNKATLLSDKTAKKLRFADNDDPTINDALDFLGGAGIVFVGKGEPSSTLDARLGDHYIDEDVTASVRVWICTARTGGTSVWGALAGAKLTMKTDIVTASGYWVAPTNLEGDVHLRLFGGGGGGASAMHAGGGGGGHMKTFTTDVILPGDRLYVTIGAGGLPGASGGVTSFGTLASASGGSPGTVLTGGGGGTGGGGADGAVDVAASDEPTGGNADYGGGGGAGGGRHNGYDYGGNGGAGGNYGGGGGASSAAGEAASQTVGGKGKNGTFSTSKRGGAGYAGSNASINGGPGKNTVGTGIEFEGSGDGGTAELSFSAGAGGGGNGGNGGNAYGTRAGGGGGGGNGGNGGDGGVGPQSVSSGTDFSSGGGGGGGWGGNGGNGGVGTSTKACGGGGGGGYGKSGNGGAGGSDGGNGSNGGIAAGGGGGATGGNGGSGIAIITYYVREVA